MRIQLNFQNFCVSHHTKSRKSGCSIEPTQIDLQIVSIGQARFSPLLLALQFNEFLGRLFNRHQDITVFRDLREVSVGKELEEAHGLLKRRF